MNTFQTLISSVLLIFVLSVIVQAIQEIVKAALNTKAAVMEKIVEKFMGEHLTSQQVKTALATRGLNITALENYNKQDFRQLLDGIRFEDPQLQGVVAAASATVDQVKDNIAASYEAARAAFLKEYTNKNKLFAILISFIVVIPLDANLISIYRQASVDSVVQQTLVGQASKVQLVQSQQQGLAQVYSDNRQEISKALRDYPILIRTSKFKEDFGQPFDAIVGLLAMGLLVSLGAPFWNDVLKGLTGMNNVLNTSGKPS